MNNHIPFPCRVYLDITNACPLSCIHCYANSGIRHLNDELSLSELKTIVTQLAELDINNLVISGGEPFCRKDIFDFLNSCLEKKIKIVLLTNGILIDSVTVKKLKGLAIDLRISLDGLSETTHDHIRGRGNFKNVLEAIKLLRSENIEKLSVHLTVNRLNLDELLRLPFFMNQVGIKDVVVSTIKPAGRALQHPELLIEPSLTLLVKDRITTVLRNKSLNLHFFKEKNWNGLSCPAGFAKFGITSDGYVTPCVFLGDNYRGGNVRESSLRDLWLSDNKLNLIRNIAVNNQCADCSAFPSQNGGCRARALYYSGSINGQDTFCCELKKQQESFGSLRISDIFHYSNKQFATANHNHSSEKSSR